MSAITDQITSTASAAGVSPALAIAVAQQESGLNPNTRPSSAGAIGLFQLMPATAAGLGVNPYDTSQNIAGGVTYLGQQLATYGGDEAKAVAAYNAGPGRVNSAVATYGADWLSYMPAETQNYVASILGPDYSATAPASAPSVMIPSNSAPLSVSLDALTASIDPSAEIGAAGLDPTALIIIGVLFLILVTRG